ncbi:MAG: iron ABC transporter permease [Pelagibacterium sp.]|uniref:FecCD family ABC transporter permease n=1 Tax=Pelagibacterium sp. TaxID=1967288 RepID=UPI0032EBAD94
MNAIAASHKSARTGVVLGLLATGFAVVVILAVALGSTWMPIADVARTLAGLGERTQTIIVFNLRMPRVALAILAGGSIAVAGFLLQRVTRNELASPSVLGVIDGAALGVVVFLMLFSNESNVLVVPIAYQPAASAIGAVLAIATVFILAGRQAVSAIRLLLFGIAVAAVAKAITTIMMIVGPIYRTSQATRWMAGAVNEASWGEIQITGLALIPLLVLTLIALRHLPPADLDETSSRSVGLNTPVFRVVIFGLAALITAAAVAFVGGVGFVGLMAPHLARLLLGRNVYIVMAGSFLLGAMMLVGADIIVRVLFAPLEVPAGTVTAVIGTPYFLFLLMRRRSSDG